MFNIRFHLTLNFLICGIKSPITSRCWITWLSRNRVCRFSLCVIGSGGMIFSLQWPIKNYIDYHRTTTVRMLYLMQAGSLAYVPVVNTSTAAWMWKFGRRACTKVSRAILASISAVSTKSIDCLSKKLIICCKETFHNTYQYPRTISIKTYCRFIHLRRWVGPFDQRQQSNEELTRTSRKIIDLNLAFHIRFAGQPEMKR